MNHLTNRSGRPTLEALEDRTVPTMSAAFPGQGVWVYDDGWRQLTAANASQVAADNNGDVVAEIPGQGVWLYNGNWQQITANNAAGLDMGYFSVSYHWGNPFFPSTETITSLYVVAQFPGQGLWRYTSFSDTNMPPHGGGTYSNQWWQQLTTNNAYTEAVDNYGRVVAEFWGQGLWLFTDNSGWRQLTPSDATSVAIGSTQPGNSRVVAEFPGYGVWRFQDNAGWQQLTAANAWTLATNANGDVVGDFRGDGVWTYSDSGTGGYGPGWNQLTAADAAMVGIDGNGNVYGQFGVDGVWYDQVGSWKLLTASNASSFGVGG
jgi:hypothetical protein